MIKTQFYLKVIIGILLAILFFIAVLLAIAVYYVAPANTSPSVPIKAQPTVKKTVIMDLKTGKPIPEAQVAAMEQKNAEELRATALSGKVIGKSFDSVQVEVSALGETHTWEIAVVPETEFFALLPIAGSPSSLEKEQKKISFADVRVGDRVTLLSQEGILVNQANTGRIKVDSLMVKRYGEPDLSND